MRNIFKNSRSGWILAVYLTQSYLDSPIKASNLLSRLPEDLSCGNRRICQFLFLGVIRHKLLIQALFGRLISKKPRPLVYALLCVAGFEVFNSEPSQWALVVHHAVEQAKQLLSPPEVRFVNACLRKFPETLSAMTLSRGPDGDPDFLSLKYSHPLWLVSRWLSEFGPEKTISLLRWDQEPPSVYFRVTNQDDFLKNDGLTSVVTPWRDFYQASASAWGKVVACAQAGALYIQDPSTRLGPALLNVQKGESVLDLCAAPGGKAFFYLNVYKKAKACLFALIYLENALGSSKKTWLR